ncbi:hypothetical protein Srot_2102 [Segniliparus rotundus DSM 44985]|uniref:Uncharacterized protein n=1 Tax=Segniliparus rotundus (strain ATCC BAA-972 / CDC 1076 / CIP 108378 / DSM 44985 / JCM 13578) TaxID=640132 RepID=D6Z9C7_SEGRD|nr:hypothetical protein [Segniliparus rotundus]ADG98557.1 hypothetical protein Srot_2102 [Segniliparus rotundus DSM 44985]
MKWTAKWSATLCGGDPTAMVEQYRANLEALAEETKTKDKLHKHLKNLHDIRRQQRRVHLRVRGHGGNTDLGYAEDIQLPLLLHSSLHLQMLDACEKPLKGLPALKAGKIARSQAQCL